MNRLLLILMALLTLFLGACNGATEAPPAEAPDMNAFQEDVEQLSALITLPSAPLEAKWTQYTLGNPNSDAPGPTDYAVIAVLRYDTATAAEIASQLGAQSNGRDWYVDGNFVRPWFPDEVKASIVPDELSNLQMVNQPAYDPTLFAKPPLLQGYAYVVGDYVVVYLQTT